MRVLVLLCKWRNFYKNIVLNFQSDLFDYNCNHHKWCCHCSLHYHCQWNHSHKSVVNIVMSSFTVSLIQVHNNKLTVNEYHMLVLLVFIYMFFLQLCSSFLSCCKTTIIFSHYFMIILLEKWFEILFF